MIGIVVSRADSASEHIGEHLLELHEWDERTDLDRPDAEGGGTYYHSASFELRTFEELHLHLGGVAAAFDDPEFVVFASRHAGETGPLLTTHHTGNFGHAEYGGEDGELARAAPNAAAVVLERLDAYAPEGYDVGLECTHHGPSDVGAPSLFVEVGSDEPQWEDPAAARAVARAILDLEGTAPDRERQLVGIGGGHYAPRFTRIVRETDWAVGHVAAEWCLGALGDPDAGRDVLRQAFERSRAAYATVDSEHPDVERIVSELGYRVVSETWVRETEHIPLELVGRLEAALCPVDEGLRFGARARGVDPGPVDVVTTALPGGLLDAAQGIDRKATLEALDRHCLAYETVEGGNRAGERVGVARSALSGQDDGRTLPDSLVDALAGVLADGYDEVAVEPDRIVAEETAFDPKLAAEAGVPEGPKFGRLASGEPVEVDGVTIDPAEVAARRRDVFRLDGDS